MYSKGEVLIIGAVALIVGFGVGYSKAREICLEALIKAMPDKNESESSGK